MGALEIKPEDIRPVDRMARVRLTRPPIDYIPELRALLSELREISDKMSSMTSHLRETLSLVIGQMALAGTQGEKPQDIKLSDILKIVAEDFQISEIDVRSSRRTANIIRPRHVAMYLSRKMTPRSLPEIGMFYGHRDHTTVLSASRNIAYLIERDENLATKVALIEHKINKLGKEEK